MTTLLRATPVFEQEYLDGLAERYRAAYAAAEPFPHVVIDDFLPPEILDAVLAEFPTPGGDAWLKHYHPHSYKLACNDEQLMGPVTRNLIYHLNSATFLTFMERLTGIDGLIPDPHMNGGGYHLIEPGGFLDVHADFNVYEKLRLDRRLNILVYLNRDWKDEYGGQLELWDREMKHMVKKVSPIFNRCLIFSTTDTSYHGHPDPLACPPDRARRSIALYYYTNGRPEEERSASHTTLYRARPGDRARAPRDARWLAKKLAPPILVDAARLLLRR